MEAISNMIKSEIFHKRERTKSRVYRIPSIEMRQNVITIPMLVLLLIIPNRSQLMVTAQSSELDHAVDLDENYRLQWRVIGEEILFEIQVRTAGYVGFGFSRDGTVYGADLVIGWIDEGHAYFQDRHVKKHGDGEPVMDPSQDYVLMKGFVNATHTVFRFKRKLDTCDINHDVPITNDTMKVLFMYHPQKPSRGAITPGTLPSPNEAFKHVVPVFLTQRSKPVTSSGKDSSIKSLDLRNTDAQLPYLDETVHWCKMFKLNNFNKKNHIIRYEPIFETDASRMYLNHIILYECQGSSPEMEIMSREYGQACPQPGVTRPFGCNSIVATWVRGSDGFSFPEETGFPIESNHARFYLMETQYANIMSDLNSLTNDGMVDNSGLRIFYIPELRKYDAGVMSIGMEPNWRHIIPPGQETVISEGHCIEECTKRAFPKQGINIFAVMMRTHQIGKQVKLRHVRGREELLPVASDVNTDSRYQEFRSLPSPVKAMPGDRLIAECIYDTTRRPTITLGGVSTREETCLIFTMYYPRQRELTTCHSLPSLPTVLHSLGINELAAGSNPVQIASPPELAGMSLENRLTSYEWETNFETFQRVTLRGSFKPMCLNAKGAELPGTRDVDGFSPNISKVWRAPPTCSFKYGSKKYNLYNVRNRYDTESDNYDSTSYNASNEDALDADDDSNNIIQIAARSKTSRSFHPDEMASTSSAAITRKSLTFQQQLLVASMAAFSVIVVSTTTQQWLLSSFLRHRLRSSK